LFHRSVNMPITGVPKMSEFGIKNDRVRLLAGQALDKVVPYTWTRLDYDEIQKLQEYFAELIVRECALTAGLMEHKGRNGIGAQLLDNFGVAK